MGAWGDLNSSCYRYLLGGGLLYAEGLISNVDLGLFYPNNGLMFSFATF